MTLRRTLLSLSAMAIGLAAFGCSTVTIRVPVTRPAEINLRGKDELVIAEITGPNNAQINGLLKDGISNSGRFKLVDRQNLDKVMAELSLSVSDLADTESRKKLGKLMVGSIMLVGAVERNDYNETTERRRQTCTRRRNKKIEKYPCTHHYRNGTASVAINFDVIDVETGENLKPKRVTCEKSKQTMAIDNPPAQIDGQGMLDTCNRSTVAEFMKAIAPWQDYVSAPFLKDGDVPQLEQGISYAQRGEWDDAIEKFEAALEFVSSLPDVDAAVVAKVHWDLGLAYEYTFQFDKAIAEVKKAYDMTLDDDFLAELPKIKKLRSDQEKLKDQLGDPAAEGGGES